MKRIPKQEYTAEFKAQAVKRADEVSLCTGRQRSVREQLRAYAIDHGVML